MGIFLEERGGQRTTLRFHDPHKRKDFDGESLGMVTAKFTAESPGRALEIVAQWITRWHLPKVTCSFPVLITAFSVNWRRRLSCLIERNEALQKMCAFRPVISKPTMRPGDFPIDSFDDIPFLQTLSTGMKLYPMQESLLRTYQEYGGATLADNMTLVVPWLLNSYCGYRAIWNGFFYSLIID